MPANSKINAIKPIGLIVAGGAAMRMGGCDKALYVYRQRCLIDWVVQAIAPQVDAIWVAYNRRVEVLTQCVPSIHLARVFADDVRWRGMGPLAGVASLVGHLGLDSAWGTNQRVLVVPCDVPYLPADLVGCLAQGHSDHCAASYIQTLDGRAHYACALVSVSALRVAQAQLCAGQRGVGAWLHELGAAAVLHSDLAGFLNVNEAI